jgi:hypothetical protein
MNDSLTITNEMLNGKLDLVLKILEQHDKRFEQQDARFEQVIDLIKNEKHEREKTEAKLEKIYESRDKVSVSFTRSWMFASFFLALLSATIVLAVDKAF